MREDTRTIIFAAGTCLVVSLLLSVTAQQLKPLQEANGVFDVKRNIVKAFGIDIAGMSREDIEATYAAHVDEDKAGELPIFTWTEDDADKASKYAFPVSGKGLWSVLYGYLALDGDLETIAGISFYKHGETPGLGAEIEKPWFQNQFKGKKLYEDGKPTDFQVVKPGTELTDTSVDGISGATLTGNGVEELLQKDAAAYAEYFKSVKEGE